MSKKLIFIFLALVICVVSVQAQLLTTACEPYGSVSVSGDPAEDNLPVVAYINGVEYARCLTSGGQYALAIDRDNSNTQDKEGWAEGDIIVIKVNGIEANPSLEAEQGRIRLDLAVSTLSIRLDSWGKIKALFK